MIFPNGHIEILYIGIIKPLYQRIQSIPFQISGHGIAIGANLPFIKLFALGNMLIPKFLAEPVTNFVFRLRRFDDLKPISAGFAGFGSKDLDNIAVLENIIKGNNFAVTPHADSFMPHLGMNAIGKIQRDRAVGQLIDIPFGGKNVNQFILKVIFHRRHKFIGIFYFLLPIQHLSQPGQLLIRLHTGFSFFVLPMSSDPMFRHLMHFLGTDLHFQRFAVGTDDRSMDRLIHILLGHRNVVLKTSRHRNTKTVYNPKNTVTFRYRFYDHANGKNIINLGKFLILGQHLTINAV